MFAKSDAMTNQCLVFFLKKRNDNMTELKRI